MGDFEGVRVKLQLGIDDSTQEFGPRKDIIESTAAGITAAGIIREEIAGRVGPVGKLADDLQFGSIASPEQDAEEKIEAAGASLGGIVVDYEIGIVLAYRVENDAIAIGRHLGKLTDTVDKMKSGAGSQDQLAQNADEHYQKAVEGSGQPDALDLVRASGSHIGATTDIILRVPDVEERLTRAKDKTTRLQEQAGEVHAELSAHRQEADEITTALDGLRLRLHYLANRSRASGTKAGLLHDTLRDLDGAVEDLAGELGQIDAAMENDKPTNPQPVITTAEAIQARL